MPAFDQHADGATTDFGDLRIAGAERVFQYGTRQMFPAALALSPETCGHISARSAALRVMIPMVSMLGARAMVPSSGRLP